MCARMYGFRSVPSNRAVWALAASQSLNSREFGVMHALALQSNTHCGLT